jgi:hypothetical protein
MLPSSNRERTVLHELAPAEADRCATSQRMNYVYSILSCFARLWRSHNIWMFAGSFEDPPFE